MIFLFCFFSKAVICIGSEILKLMKWNDFKNADVFGWWSYNKYTSWLNGGISRQSHKLLSASSWYLHLFGTRSLFRTQSNICYEGFFENFAKKLVLHNDKLFSLDPNFAFSWTNDITTRLNNFFYWNYFSKNLPSLYEISCQGLVGKNLAAFSTYFIFSLEVLQKTYAVSSWLLIFKTIFHAKSLIITQARSLNLDITRDIMVPSEVSNWLNFLSNYMCRNRPNGLCLVHNTFHKSSVSEGIVCIDCIL